MKVNRSNTAGGNYLNEEGTFEAFIYSYQLGKTSSGANSIVINYRIRTDVDQSNRGAVVDFADNYNDGEISQMYLNSLIVNANVEESKLPNDKEVTMKQNEQALLGKPVKITNKREPKYNDPSKIVNKIKATAPTDFPNVAEGERTGKIKGDVTNNNQQSAPRAPQQPNNDPFAGQTYTDGDAPF
jgi:hypothetical protein